MNRQTERQTHQSDFMGGCGTNIEPPIFHDKAFSIAKNLKYDGYQRGLASMFYKVFDKKLLVKQLKMKICKELAEELHKPIIRTFKKRKVHSSFVDNIWGTDLADT